MMTLVAFDDPGLVILPTHRVVRRLPADAVARFGERCREHFVVEEFAHGPVSRRPGGTRVSRARRRPERASRISDFGPA